MRIVLIIIAIALLGACASPRVSQDDAERIAITFGEPLSVISKDWQYSSLKPYLHPAVESENNFSEKLKAASVLGAIKGCEPADLKPSSIPGLEEAIQFVTDCHFENGTAKVAMLGALYQDGGSVLFAFEVTPK